MVFSRRGITRMRMPATRDTSGPMLRCRFMRVFLLGGYFRRLGRKTQVHPVSSNDHIHTRLTHSLEVSCVGRSLGMRVGEMIRDALPDWCEPSDLGMVVQSACLAHDIGNPP